MLTEDKEKLLSENQKLEKQQKKLQQDINKMVQSNLISQAANLFLLSVHFGGQLLALFCKLYAFDSQIFYHFFQFLYKRKCLAGQETEQIRKEGEAIRQEVSELSATNLLLKEQTAPNVLNQSLFPAIGLWCRSAP